MINEEIIKIASNTSNVGLKKKYSHKISLKNSICGDKITLGIVADKKKITSMNYETESCVYCEASASLLSRKIKIPKKYSEFKKLLNSDNFNRFKCIFLPFDAVIKALKL